MEKNHYEKERAEFYKKFSEFSKIEYELVTKPLIEALESNLWWLENKTWLDYWCWNWFVTDLIYKKWAHIIWVDNSFDQIEKAKWKEQDKMKFIHINGNDISFIDDNSLDFCFFRFSTCEMNDETLDIVFKNVHSKLKKWWVLVIGDQNREKCVWHETMDVCYSPYKSDLLEWELTTTMLKKHGVKFIWNEENLVENMDFMPITDYFRTKFYMKTFLEKNWFINIDFKEIKLDNESTLVCFDEKEIAIYKITTARK